MLFIDIEIHFHSLILTDLPLCVHSQKPILQNFQGCVIGGVHKRPPVDVRNVHSGFVGASHI